MLLRDLDYNILKKALKRKGFKVRMCPVCGKVEL